jgi:putative glutamine amidotransferase
MARPKIAIPGRFTESASALRYRGLVSSRALVESVWRAGGDPVTLLPAADGLDWAERLRGFDGVLLPGGGDVHPSRYGAPADHEALYDMDEVQDETDFTLARHCLEHGVPMLAVCRGLHVVNALLGGTLVIDMPVNHRHHVHPVALTDPDDRLGIGSKTVTASCYHHQAVEVLANGLTVLGRADDDCIEAVSIDAPGWAVGVQWHPEDTEPTDPDQQALFRRFVREAARAAAAG